MKRHNKDLKEIKLNNSSRSEMGEGVEMSVEERSALRKTYFSSMITAVAALVCCCACFITFTVAAFSIDVTGNVTPITTAGFTVTPAFVSSDFSTFDLGAGEIPFGESNQIDGWPIGSRYIISANPSGNTPVGWYCITVTYPDVNGAVDENGNAVYHTQKYVKDYSYDPTAVNADSSVSFVTYIEGTTVTVDGNWGARPEELNGLGWTASIQVGTPEDAFKTALRRGDTEIYLTDSITVTDNITLANNTTIVAVNGGVVITVAENACINTSAALVMDGVTVIGNGGVRTQSLVNVNDNGSLVLSGGASVSGFELADNVSLLSAVYAGSGNVPVINLNGGNVVGNDLGAGSYPVSLYNGALLMANSGTVSGNTWGETEMALYTNVPYTYNIGAATLSGVIDQPDPYAEFLADLISGESVITLKYPFTVTDTVSISNTVTVQSADAGSPVVITVASEGSFDILGGLVLNSVSVMGDSGVREDELFNVHEGGILNLGTNTFIRGFALSDTVSLIYAEGDGAGVILNGATVSDNTLGANSYPVYLTSGARFSANHGSVCNNISGEKEVAVYTDTRDTYSPSPEVFISGEVNIDTATPYEEFLAAIARGDTTIVLTDNFTITDNINISHNTVITSADALAPAVITLDPNVTVTVNAGLTLSDIKLSDGTGLVRTAPLFKVVGSGNLTLGERAYICGYTTADNVHLIEAFYLGEGDCSYVMLNGGFIMDNTLGANAYPVSLTGGSVLNANTGSITNNFSVGVDVAVIRDDVSLYNAGNAPVTGAVTVVSDEQPADTPVDGEQPGDNGVGTENAEPAETPTETPVDPTEDTSGTQSDDNGGNTEDNGETPVADTNGDDTDGSVEDGDQSEIPAETADTSDGTGEADPQNDSEAENNDTADGLQVQ